MKTEEEARKCWCPFARESATYTVEGFGYSYNRTFGREDKARCIASECMAWRWWEISNNKDALWSPASGQIISHDLSSRHGYCGLAGKP